MRLPPLSDDELERMIILEQQAKRGSFSLNRNYMNKLTPLQGNKNTLNYESNVATWMRGPTD
jgi:hypothetical protein